MEKREFTRFHLIMIIAAIVGILTIIWTVVAIRNIKIKEAEEVLKKVDVIEVVEEKQEEELLPEGVEEPDFTPNEFESQKLQIQLDNTVRYNIDELNSIINELVECKDADGNNIELSLSADNSLEEALITKDMYEKCLSVWLPKNNCVILIFEIGNNSPGDVTNNIREYFNFMERSSSNNDTINTYRHYETFSYSGYTVYLACNNALDLSTAIQNYMINKDNQAVLDFESLYDVNEYGAYLKDTEEENDLGTLPENIEDVEVYEETLETEEN